MPHLKFQNLIHTLVNSGYLIHKAANMKFLLILIATLYLTSAADLDWYKTASFYQVYPQSFYDGGGGSRQGFGTFEGIKKKLDYIKDLGIDCIWLTPIFESTYEALGYDITNYDEVDSRYGTKKGFEDLVKAIHEKGMKVIVDYVPNHCGAEHEFFKASMIKNGTYDNWFVWADGTGPNNATPPSNWQHIGGPPGSAWNRHLNGVEIERKEFYYAQFYSGMPDFNFREPAVRQYFEDFLRNWLNFGLDGFRIDAISHGYEFVFSNGTYPDEPVKPNATDPNDFGYLDHIYTQDQPELFELVYRWREILDEFNDTAR